MTRTTISNGDAGSVVRAALNSMFSELYLPQRQINPLDPTYGAKFDGVRLADITSSSGSATISSASYTFVTADIGKCFGLVTATNERPNSPAAYGRIGTISSISSGSAVLSATANVNCSGDGVLYFGTDDTTALQAALDACNTVDTGASGTWLNTGGGTLVLPVGMAITTTGLNIRNNVSIKGQGRGLSTLKWLSTGNMNTAGNHAMIQYEYANGSTRIYRDNQLLDFCLDARAATVGSYGYQAKCIIGLYMIRPIVARMSLLGSPATACGVDYINGGIFADNYVENPGRLWTSPGGGGSGFDFQSNLSSWNNAAAVEMEAVVMSRNFILNPGVSGIRNTDNNVGLGDSRTIIANNTVVTNKTTGKGIEDNGHTGAVITGNTVRCSATMTTAGPGGGSVQERWAGIIVSGGQYGSCTGNTVIGGWYDGILLRLHDYSTSTLMPNDYIIANNNVKSSVRHGIRLECDSTYTMASISVNGNRVSLTGSAGIAVTNTGTAGTTRDLHFSGNAVRDAGQTTATDVEKSGFLFDNAIAGMLFNGNQVYDSTTKTKYGVTINAVAITDAMTSANLELYNNVKRVTTTLTNLAGGGSIAA